MKKLIDAEVVIETAKAVRLIVSIQEGGTAEAWFPLSQLTFAEDDNGVRTGEIYAEDWIIEKLEEELENYILTS